MPCIPVDLGGGAVGIVCTGRQRFPKCSTPRCRNRGRLECDHPVDREHPDQAKRGDARVHRERLVVFYVWSVAGSDVTISTTPPGTRRGVLQTVPLADWWAKTAATCNSPICDRCAVRVGRLDVCAAHAGGAA